MSGSPMGAPQSLLEWALWYAHLGWPVFPLHSVLMANGAAIGCSCGAQPCREEPKRRGKHPRTKNGVKNATLDTRVIREWWTQWPDANIGVSTDGIVVLDVDPMKNGDSSLLSLIAEVGRIPQTVTSETGSGGHHYVFRGSRTNGNGLRPGIDVKSNGGYIVVPPSNHWTGGSYSWVPSHGPEDLAPIDAPEWLLGLARVKGGEASGKPRLRVVEGGRGRSDGGGGGYAAAALRSAVEAVRYAPDGTRNDALNRETYGMAGLVATGALREVDVRQALEAAGLGAGLTAHEVEATIDSAMRAGLAAPREVPTREAHAREPTTGVRERDTVEATEVPGGEPDLLMDQGKPAKIAENVARVLEATWRPRLDTFRGSVEWTTPLPPELTGSPRFGAEVRQSDLVAIQTMCLSHGLTVGLPIVESGLGVAADRCHFDSLREYVLALPEWDGTARLATWTSRYLGTPDTPYYRASGAAWLRACVARALHPGCLVDIVPVMIDPKGGVGKNWAVFSLFGRMSETLGSRWDPDALGVKKLACERWVLHDDELEARPPREIAALRSWVSRVDESYVPKYSNHLETRPRRAVLVCSSNNEKFNSDSSGGRRWYPWHVSSVDGESLREDALQLLSEARLAIVSDGANAWRDGLAEVRDAQEDHITEAGVADDLVVQLQALVESGQWVAEMAAAGISHLLGVTVEKATPDWSRRLGVSVRLIGGQGRRVGRCKAQYYTPPQGLGRHVKPAPGDR